MMLPLVIAVMPEGADRDYMEWLFVEHHRLMMVTAFGIVPQSADATRAVLASRNVAFQETPVGAWTGFAVAAAAWPAAPPPALFWTGPGLLAGRRQP